MSPLIFLLTLTLTLSTSIYTPKVNAQTKFCNFDFLKCEDYCDQLPTDYKYQGLKITQKLINQLLRGSGVCEESRDKFNGACYVAKSYKFKDGVISLKVVSHERSYTDIKFNSDISPEQAANLAKQSFNNGESFDKTEHLIDRIVLFASPSSYAGDGKTYYLRQIYLILTPSGQVVRIISVQSSL
ncbi:MAG: hypothetical protein F6K61_19070 [Sphaerospermopsis sp. SIO1G1]|nr:hypothetical protein [Sphaerospermopsis sp. SIO1G1]